MDSATKEKVIVGLNAKIDKLEEALKVEKEKSEMNEERIKILQEQLDDLFETLKEAQAA